MFFPLKNRGKRKYYINIYLNIFIMFPTERKNFPQDGVKVAPPWSKIHLRACSISPIESSPSPSNLKATQFMTEQNIVLVPSMCSPQPPCSFYTQIKNIRKKKQCIYICFHQLTLSTYTCLVIVEISPDLFLMFRCQDSSQCSSHMQCYNLENGRCE